MKVKQFVLSSNRVDIAGFKTVCYKSRTLRQITFSTKHHFKTRSIQATCRGNNGDIDRNVALRFVNPRYRKQILRAVATTGFLMMLVVTGCATPGRLASVSKSRSEIVRADSDALSNLESATHNRKTQEEKPKSPESKSHGSKCDKCGNRSCTCGSSRDDNELNQLFGQAFFAIISAPFTIPALFLGDKYDHYTEFPDYPYAEDVPGSLLFDSENNAKKQSWTGNFQAVAIPGNDHVERFGGRLVLESGMRFGIDTEAGYLTRVRSNGGNNSVWIGDANLVYRFAESEHVQMRTGIGVNWLSDQIRPEAGFNFTYGVDWFPRKPWTVSSIIDVGTLGQANLFHNRSTIGVMLGATEAFVGYDYLQINSAKIQGPVAGIGWRF